VAISGTSDPASGQAGNRRSAYIVEREIVRYVRLLASLAPTRAESVLGPGRIVRGGEDHGRHLRRSIKNGLERSAHRDGDASPLPALALSLAQTNELAVVGRPGKA
jgi:hypothetical protein